MNRHRMIVIILVLLFVVFPGCDREPEEKGPQIGIKPSTSSVPTCNFSVHPLHNPAKLMQAYQPLIDDLNGRLQGVRLSLGVSRGYASFEVNTLRVYIYGILREIG